MDIDRPNSAAKTPEVREQERARQQLLDEVIKVPPGGAMLETAPAAPLPTLGERVRKETLHVGSAGAGIGLGTFLGRVAETPRTSELSALAARYPASNWHSITGTDTRWRLNNIASWGKTGAHAYPEAEALLHRVERRGTINSLTAAIAGSAINYALDKAVYAPTPYGPYSSLFDSVGVAVIAGIPEVPVVVKTGIIVAGHAFARRFDQP